MFSFELKKNDEFVLQQPDAGALPPGCRKPDPAALDHGVIGDIVCLVDMEILEGDTLTPTWYDVSTATSLDDNDGTMYADIYGYVERHIEPNGGDRSGTGSTTSVVALSSAH